MTAWVQVAAGHFFLHCAQIYCAVRTSGRSTHWWRIGAFAALQTLALLLVTSFLPLMELRFLLLSLTHLVFFQWIFQTGMFPDALFAYLIPLSLQILGRALVLPFFAYHLLPIIPNTWAVRLLGPQAEYTAYLPSIILACFFLLTETRKGAERLPSYSPSHYFGWCLIFLAMAVSCHQTALVLRTVPNLDGTYLSLLGIRLIVFPILVFILHQFVQRERRNEKVLRYHVKRSSVQNAALRTLREERHDLLNELTLISTYVQMGKTEEALQAIAYSAAKLSDRHNYSTLPNDAWSTVLQVKQAEAERLGITFSLDLQSEAPQDFHEQRLLPKVIMNLVDNAFAAVEGRQDPLVHLSWSVDSQGRRQLSVSNNGPEISSLEGKRIFRGGVTSKADPSGNHGWGLVICQRIAEELGGTLTYTSSPELTTFTLTLPPATARKQQQISAT